MSPKKYLLDQCLLDQELIPYHCSSCCSHWGNNKNKKISSDTETKKAQGSGSGSECIAVNAMELELTVTESHLPYGIT